MWGRSRKPVPEVSLPASPEQAVRQIKQHRDSLSPSWKDRSNSAKWYSDFHTNAMVSWFTHTNAHTIHIPHTDHTYKPHTRYTHHKHIQQRDERISKYIYIYMNICVIQYNMQWMWTKNQMWMLFILFWSVYVVYLCCINLTGGVFKIFHKSFLNMFRK